MAGAEPAAAEYRRLADEADAMLERDVLGKWFPAAVDPAGGFYEDFAADWSRSAGGTHGLVYQSRLTWSAAAAAARAASYLAATRHGLAFLRERQWDREHGGFFWSTDAEGAPCGDHAAEKHAYGQAFGIYAAAAGFRATQDPAALDLAQRGFAWLDAHAHDADHGGYAEALSPDGTPLPAPMRGRDAIGTRYGLKSANTHIHLLEALTALHAVWPDPAVRVRLEEVFGLVRDRIVAPLGHLTLFFRPDWQRLSGLASHGHDLEAAVLLAEAARIIGERDAGTGRSMRALVDHAVAHGEDAVHGGFFNEGPPDGLPRGTDKIWWVQAEGLNALLLMHARHGAETLAYWQAFLRTWQFLRAHQRDPVHGGWHPVVSAEGVPLGGAKSDGWTDPYHQARALLAVGRRLRRLAAAHA